jgi:hypothetical protein
MGLSFRRSRSATEAREMAMAKGVHKYSVAIHRKENEVSVNQQSEAVFPRKGGTASVS